MRMKTQRLVILIASSIALVAVMAVAVVAYWPGKQPVFEDLPGLIFALQAFSQDRTKQGEPLPSTVSLRELVSRGYISSNSVHAFEGTESTIWLTVNETKPQQVLMSARLPDGSVSAVLADGSVHQFSARRFAEHLRTAGQDAPANGSRPAASGTNGMSAAAGSRR
jgi:hypothetical protein